MNINLKVSYDLCNPESAASLQSQRISILYSLFGILVILTLLVNYLIKALYTCPNEAVSEYAHIFPHVLALKAAPFVVYPVYAEEIAYAYGFMAAELPWANEFFATKLSDRSESVPVQYGVYYHTMSFSSTYTLGFILGTAVIFLLWLSYRSKTKNVKKDRLEKVDENEALFVLSKFNWGLPHWPIKIVMYNLFMFGLVFNASASFQGALLNPITKISISAIFTVVGIICLIVVFFDCLLSIKESPLFFFKLRTFAKAVLLSACWLSPLYIFCTALIVDVLLMVIEFRLTKTHKSHPKLWLLNNFLANFTLLILVIIHSHYFTLIFASLFVLGIVAVELYVHCKDQSEERKKNRQIGKKNFMIGDGEQGDSNIWDVNFDKLDILDKLDKELEGSK